MSFDDSSSCMDNVLGMIHGESSTIPLIGLTTGSLVEPAGEGRGEGGVVSFWSAFQRRREDEEEGENARRL